MTITAQQAAVHRREIAGLVVIATSDLRQLMEPHSTAEGVRDALLADLPGLVDVYGSSAAALAADWYDQLRTDHVAAGRFTAIAAELTGPARIAELARWGVGPLFQAQPDKAQAIKNVSGGLQKIIADASRDTVAGSAIADPAAEGWKRFTFGACSYCRSFGGLILTSHPEVSEFHTNCGCVAAPAFS